MEKNPTRDRRSYKTHEKSEEVVKDEDNCNQEIFIKNLNYNTTEPELKSFFKKYGDVIKVKILQTDGKSKGFGFVQFKSSKDAKDVLRDGENLEIDGRKVSVSWANQKSSNSSKFEKERSRSRDGSHRKKYNSRNYDSSSYSKESRESYHTVFVGNLSFKSRESKIKEFFSDCGKVANVKVGLSQEGKSRGFCHVDFESKEALTAALQKNGQELDGRPLRINESKPHPPSRKDDSRRR